MSGTKPYARIYNALRAANVPEAQATDAADALLSIKDDEVTALRGDIKELRRDVSDIKGDLKAMRVETRILGALVLAMFVRMFFPGLFS